MERLFNTNDLDNRHDKLLFIAEVAVRNLAPADFPDFVTVLLLSLLNGLSDSELDERLQAAQALNSERFEGKGVGVADRAAVAQLLESYL